MSLYTPTENIQRNTDMFNFPFPNWKWLEQIFNSTITFSWCNLKICSICSPQARKSNCWRLTNLLPIFHYYAYLYWNVGFVTSSSAISLLSAALLGFTYLICFEVSKKRDKRIREMEVHTEKAIKNSVKKIPQDSEDAWSMVTGSCEIQ